MGANRIKALFKALDYDQLKIVKTSLENEWARRFEALKDNEAVTEIRPYHRLFMRAKAELDQRPAPKEGSEQNGN